MLDIEGQAEDEIRNRFEVLDHNQPGRATAETSIDTDYGTVVVQFAEPLMELVRSLRMAANQNDAIQALDRADEGLDDWEQSQTSNLDDHSTVFFPFGVRVQLPPAINFRG